MTLAEKIGQMTQLFSFIPDAKKPEDHARSGDTGSYLFLTDPAVMNRLQHIAVEESRLHIPLLFGFDLIHGFKTIFPVPLALAASWDPAMIERVQTIAAREASAAGVRWAFAPMVDIARDPRWGRIVEGAGEDPYLGSAVARAQVRGFQGAYPGEAGHVLACAKHFAGYGATDGGRDYDSSNISEDLLRNVYLPPFHAAADAGAATFMTAYMDLNGVPATANRFLLQQVLRGEWGFRGFVVSDAFSVHDLLTHGFARDEPDAAYRALTAGVDMDMGAQVYSRRLAALVKQDRISVATIDQAVRRILAAKFRLGLFENPYVDEANARNVIGAPMHHEATRVAAQRSAVLLRNEGGLLPLNKTKYRSIAVIGPLSDSGRDIRGSWVFVGNPNDAVTVFKGIRGKLDAGIRVEYAQGVELRREYPSIFDGLLGIKHPPELTQAQSDTLFQAAVDLARRSDIAILVLGESQEMSGEGASRSTLALAGRQEELLKAVVALGKPAVLLLENGRPLDISWAAEHVPAILEMWFPGDEGGRAAADLLFGDASPGGKLPVTWPRSTGQIPIYYAHNLTHQPENKPGFTSRYWDIPTSPLYPFGYGLGYTTFQYSNLHLDRAEAPAGETIHASVDVTNTGSRAGDEVVQLYIHQQAGSASRPVRELKGFERVTLGQGEKKTIRFTLGRDELSFWSSAEKKWVVEPEQFDIWAGGDSTATLHASFRLTPPQSSGR